MAKLLYIKANCKPPGESRTFQISDRFIECYQEQNPRDEVITLDLYKEQIDFLRSEDLEASKGKDEHAHHPVIQYAKQFASADKYVIAAPMWNLGNPAILKAYMDYVCISGITFHYTEQGAEGLCKGNKALYIGTRGGNYSAGGGAKYEMGERYLKAILQFFGIEEIERIVAENMDVHDDDPMQRLQLAVQEAEELSKRF